MRAFFLLIVLAGIGAGFVYPWAITDFSGREIGSYPVYERGGSFRPVTVSLRSEDAPVRVIVDMTALSPPEFARQSTVLTLTASTAGQTVLAETISFFEAKPVERNPQTREKFYRDEAGVISPIENGDYLFVIGRGDVENIQMRSVDLVLRAGAGVVDPRVAPIGYAVTAFGFVGLVLAMRRRRGERNPNSQPPAPRWGRGAGGDKPGQ